MRLALLALILFASCKNDPDIVVHYNSDLEYPSEKITDAEIIHTENGAIKLKIVANTINRYEKSSDNLVDFEDIIVTFYNNNVQSSRLVADLAYIDNDNIMTVKKNVVLSNKINVLETNKLIWDEESKIIFTNDSVKITSKEEVIFGQGFTSNSDFTEYSIKNINGIISIVD